MDKDNQFFEKIYYNPKDEAGYAGAYRLVNKIQNKVDKNNIYKWLRAQDAYTLHKPVRRKFQRLHYNVQTIDSVWEGDLIELSSLKTFNDDFSYLLVVIDVLSKYAFVEPIKDKTCLNVTEAFEKILSRSSDRIPIIFQTDKGSEFLGREMQTFLKSKNIIHRVTRNPDVKAAIVERFNRTLKERMWRYFTHKNTKRYIDILYDLVQGYNNSRHSTIKMAPAAVTIYNAQQAKRNMDSRYKTPERKPKYSVGNLVRISRTKGTFEKGYEANWSEEIFKIIKILKHRKPPVYELEDLNGELIDGIFYEEELSVIEKDLTNTEYIIDKILKTSGKGKKKKYFVSWVGYPSKFNSWIPASNLKKI